MEFVVLGIVAFLIGLGWGICFGDKPQKEVINSYKKTIDSYKRAVDSYEGTITKYQEVLDKQGKAIDYYESVFSNQLIAQNAKKNDGKAS